MTIEERLDQLEKRNKRLTAALTLMAVAICAVVTVAATGDKHGYFDAVFARNIFVENDAGDLVVSLSVDDVGNGLVNTRSANGKELVSVGATDNGGFIEVSNKTGESIATMYADEYGNGVVGAYNREGRGPELRPGP